MTKQHVPLLALDDVARLEELRIAAGISKVADEFRPFAGGVAARSAPGGWTNAAIGAGFHGPVAADEVDAMIAWYVEKGIEPRVELAPYADASLVGHLANAGFVVRVFEQVFMRPLSKSDRFDPPHPTPREVSIEPVVHDDEAMIDAYARIVLSGFMGDATDLPEEFLETSRRVARHPQTTAIVARWNGVIVGGATMECGGKIGALFGTSVKKEFRRRGIQEALIAWRLRAARDKGAIVATISARPFVATERTARRVGFEVAYTKAILVRPGAGLVPVAE